MQTQYEVNNFFRVNFISNLNSFSSFIARNWPIYSLQMELKGLVGTFPVYGRPRIIDLLSGHGNPTPFFIFGHKFRCTWDVVVQPAYMHVVQ
jgi:hypothetical protein